jgi:hypothetical protein
MIGGHPDNLSSDTMSKDDSKDDFEEFPPELILLLSNFLSTPSLNALGSTCRRVHEILQPELESRITPDLAAAFAPASRTTTRRSKRLLATGTSR